MLNCIISARFIYIPMNSPLKINDLGWVGAKLLKALEPPQRYLAGRSLGAEVVQNQPCLPQEKRRTHSPATAALAGGKGGKWWKKASEGGIFRGYLVVVLIALILVLHIIYIYKSLYIDVYIYMSIYIHTHIYMSIYICVCFINSKLRWVLHGRLFFTFSWFVGIPL